MYSIEACRICLQQKPEQNLTPTSSVNEDDGVSFLERLKYCVNEVNWSSDDFPSLLCDDCIKDLLNASKFKSRCIETDMRRQKYIKEQSDINKATVVDFVIKTVEEIKEEPVAVEETEINDNCDLELMKIDIDEIKVAYNETNECVEEDEQRETPVLPPYIDERRRFCLLCKRKFTAGALWNHIQMVHTCEIKYSCDLCPQKFTSGIEFKKHRTSHTGGRDYVCYVCDKTFMTCSDLNTHLRYHENNKKYKCDLCDKGFNDAEFLQKHKQYVHTNPEQWTHHCAMCGQKFVSQSELRVHMNRHRNLNNLTCSSCEKQFVTKTELENHSVCHSKVQLHKCEMCEAEYEQKSLLTRHVKIKHGVKNVVMKETIKKFACNECPKKFTLKRLLLKHMLSQHGISENNSSDD